MSEIKFTILGEPASKANSRQAVPRKSKAGKVFVAFIKSDKAQEYSRTALLQIPKLPELMQGPLAIECKIYYASERPDLDPSLIFDLLQGRVLINDRQLREHHLYHRIDKQNPRAEIRIWSINDQAPLIWES